MGRAGFDLARKKFSADRNNDRLLDMAEALASGQQATRRAAA
jgi:hypothetical protein